MADTIAMNIGIGNNKMENKKTPKLMEFIDVLQHATISHNARIVELDERIKALETKPEKTKEAINMRLRELEERISLTVAVTAFSPTPALIALIALDIMKMDEGKVNK